MKVRKQYGEIKGEKNTWKTGGKKEEVAFIYSCRLMPQFVTTS